MKVLLTGASGMLGKSISIKLKETVDLYTVSRKLPHENFSFDKTFQLDLQDRSGFSKLVAEILPDVLIHCAAIIPSTNAPDSMELARINSNIDSSVFTAVRKHKCKLIYMSSSIVYGYPNENINVEETFPVIKSSNYASQKIKSENFILRNFKDGLILRINAPFGLYMRHETVITKFIKQALKNEPILLLGSGNRMQDFTSTIDIANLIQQLIENEKWPSGIFNISHGKPISMKDLATNVVKIIGSESVILRSNNMDPQEEHRASYSIEKAKKKLNWNPIVTVEIGIQELIKNILN